MNRLPTLLLGLALLVCGRSGAVEWEAVVPGVEHGRIVRDGVDAHVVRVDLDAPCIAVVATPAADRGLTVSEFAAQIRAATKIKPVVAYVSDTGASAAYWIASAASELVIRDTAAVGSIGTVMALWDRQQAVEKQGYKRVVIRSGPYKALAQDGEAMTDAVVAELQRECNAYAAAFYDAVRAGRGLTDDQAEQCLNGRCFMSQEAQSLGLIDDIRLWNDFLNTTTANHQEARMPLFGKKPEAPPVSAGASQGLSKAQFAALAAAYPECLNEIQDLDAQGNEAGQIEASILKGKLNQAKEALAAASKTAQDVTQTHAQTLAAKDQELATLKAQVEKFKDWTGAVSATPDPGSDAQAGAANADTSEGALKAEWGALNPAVRSEWANDFETWAFRKKEALAKAKKP
jgi:signal peptide peptidase SppA